MLKALVSHTIASRSSNPSFEQAFSQRLQHVKPSEPCMHRDSYWQVAWQYHKNAALCQLVVQAMRDTLFNLLRWSTRDALWVGVAAYALCQAWPSLLDICEPVDLLGRTLQAIVHELVAALQPAAQLHFGVVTEGRSVDSCSIRGGMQVQLDKTEQVQEKSVASLPAGRQR